jgi:hypothetical protein
MRLSHIGAPQCGHFGKLSANRSGSKTVDAGMGASMRSIERLLRAGSVSSRRLLKLS